MVDELSRILADPSVPGRIPPESIPPLMAQLAALQSALAARLISGQSNSNGNSEGDRLLGIQEAAQKIGVTEDWLYRRTDKLPFVVRLGRNVRFSERGIEKYIRLRMGR